MGKVLVTDTHLTDIANAIREKNGETTTYKPGDMATAISNISGGSGAKSPVDEFYDAYERLYAAVDPSYNKTYDTNESVVLYTPAEGYTNYFIVQQTEGGYRVIWSKSQYIIGWYRQPDPAQEKYYFSLSTTYNINGGSIYNSGSKTAIVAEGNLVKPSALMSAQYYQSSSRYTTIERCIEVIKDPTTSYNSLTSTSYNALPYNNTNTCVIATNAIEIDSTGQINECGRQISSHETIEVTQTQ